MEKPGHIGSQLLVYRVFLDSEGKVVSFRQVRGPKMPRVEAELTHTRAVRPAYHRGDPVPVVFTVKIVSG